jgi:hypothetical protein
MYPKKLNSGPYIRRMYSRRLISSNITCLKRMFDVGVLLMFYHMITLFLDALTSYKPSDFFFISSNQRNRQTDKCVFTLLDKRPKYSMLNIADDPEMFTYLPTIFIRSLLPSALKVDPSADFLYLLGRPTDFSGGFPASRIFLASAAKVGG